MSRFRRKPVSVDGTSLPREEQLSLYDRFHSTYARVREKMGEDSRTDDPRALSTKIFFVVLALSGIGLMLQLSHSSTTMAAEDFWRATVSQLVFRMLGVGALLAGLQLGPQGLRRFLPALLGVAIVALVLVYVPGVGATINGAKRWVSLGFVSFQPSEVARVIGLLWLAHRLAQLEPPVKDFKRDIVPLLLTGGLVFGLILFETDTGGALLFMACFGLLLWIGGAELKKIAGPILVVVLLAVAGALTFVSYVRDRIAMWLGNSSNAQVTDSLHAIASGDAFGNGFGQGLWRNARVPYLETDYIFALVGEEFGLFGMLLVAGLFMALLVYGLRYALSIKDRYAALAAFGLVLTVIVQAMIHMQVVVQLAPPKGMPLPFLSHGGTSLIVSSFAIGVALGAARRDTRPADATMTTDAPAEPAAPAPTA